jgi:hypothetical protein
LMVDHIHLPGTPVMAQKLLEVTRGQGFQQ